MTDIARIVIRKKLETQPDNISVRQNQDLEDQSEIFSPTYLTLNVPFSSNPKSSVELNLGL